MDKIFVQGLEVECVIGVWEWERQITQKLIIDLEMGWDIATAAKTDALADTLSYKDVACLLYTSPSPRDVEESRMPSSA